MLIEAEVKQNKNSGMTLKVFKGTFWILFGQISALLVSFITTPFIIRLLGKENYGILVLVNLIPAYLAFSDFGMGLASTRFASKAYAENSTKKEGEAIRSTLLMGFVSSCIVAITLFSFSDLIVKDLLKISENIQTQVISCFKISSLILVFRNINLILNTPQLVRLRMDLNSIITSGGMVLQSIATLLTLYLGGDIVQVVTVILFISLLTLIGNFAVSYSLLPNLLETGFSKSFASIVKFGGALVISAFAGILLVNTEKFVLTRVTDVATLSYYSVAYTLSSMVTTFSGAMIQSLIPAFSQLQGQENQGTLNNLYSRGIRFNIYLIIPMMCLMIIFAKPFFTLWAGEDFGRESVVPFYILLFGLFFNILAYFPHSAITASGRTDIFAKLYWGELIPYLLIVAYLTSRFGAKGAALAWSLRVIFDSFAIFCFAKKAANVSFIIEKNKTIFTLLAISLFLPSLLINFSYSDYILVSIFLYSIGLLFYFILIWKIILPDLEKSWLQTKIRSSF